MYFYCKIYFLLKFSIFKRLIMNFTSILKLKPMWVVKVWNKYSWQRLINKIGYLIKTFSLKYLWTIFFNCTMKCKSKLFAHLMTPLSLRPHDLSVSKRYLHRLETANGGLRRRLIVGVSNIVVNVFTRKHGVSLIAHYAHNFVVFAWIAVCN